MIGALESEKEGLLNSVEDIHFTILFVSKKRRSWFLGTKFYAEAFNV